MPSTESYYSGWLENASGLILDGKSFVAAEEGVAQLRDLLYGEKEGIIRARDIVQGQIPLTAGLALRPIEAALCINDTIRTIRFLRGLRAAIRQAQSQFPGEKIEVLDAGSGPLAALTVPLTTQFKPHEVQFVPLDIYSTSVRAVEKIVATLGVEAFIPKVVQADAAHYQHHCAPHIIVTETMQRGLLTEPQPAITTNLAPQLREGGIFVPEEVFVWAYLKDADGEATVTLGPVFTLNKEIRGKVQTLYIDFQLPDLPADRIFDLYLGTRVKIFGEQTLELHESSITRPHKVADGVNRRKSTNISIEYTPGKTCRVMPSSGAAARRRISSSA